ncbi:hypothetical protein KUTeg_009178 [Tegillarca granosa]|uniref:TLDc domain-containing protein n=1 Tax=Tegillarca granosa TaxID=220873 RepID=A0ABQ9F9I1_TEGGR|nr:hypothetical protein KUTeg_009178 [Tegillarca granosa]
MKMANPNPLTENDEAVLSEMIANGPKKFVLLFDASRDTCDPAAFHQKCDNKGPTLTIINNSKGCTYGGYTSISWLSGTGVNMYDGNAFLFQLNVQNESRPCKLPIKTPESAIFQSAENGPTFGSGPDLQSFKGVVAVSEDNLFPLNTTMIPGSYDFLGHTVESITSGVFDAYNIQVYSVRDKPAPDMLPEPWRPLNEWNEELLQKMKKEIEDYSPLQEIGLNDDVMPHVNILLLGPIGAGKSSFFNTIDSIFRGRMAMKARAGSLQNSLTKRFRIFPVLSTRSRRCLRFRICDCRGLEDDQGIDPRDIEAILDGHVPDGYLFNPSNPISKDTCPKYVKDPGLECRIHCVVFVVDSNNVSTDAVDTGMDIMTEKVKEKVTKLQEIMNQKEIPQLILMNKIDGFCQASGKNLRDIFYSPKVKSGVKKVAETLGLPEYTVLPMKNINSEQGPGIDTNIGILALYNLRQILHAADDYLSYFLPELLADKIEYTFNSKESFKKDNC